MTFWIKDNGKLFSLRVPDDIKIVYQPLKGLSLFSNKNFKKGQKIVSLKGKIVKINKASSWALQFDEKHCIDGNNYVPEDFINHSCDPNVKVDLKKRYFIATRNIPKNTEITFNYLTVEWDLKIFGLDFVCHCGSKNCYRNIRGFKYLSFKQKLELKPYLSPFLIKKLEKQHILESQ